MDYSQLMPLRFMQVILIIHSFKLLILNYNELKQGFKWIKVKVVDLSLQTGASVAISRIYNEVGCYWGRSYADWKKFHLRINSFGHVGMT